MLVEIPAADADRVFHFAVQAHQVLLREHVIADQPPGFAFAGQHADPIERPIGRRGMLARVLDVVPDAQHDRQQFEADPLVVADGVDLAAPFDPPIAIFPGADAAEFELLVGDLAGPGGRHKRHRPAEIARGEQDAAALRLAVGRDRRQRFAELVARFVAGAHLGPGLQSQPAVAGAIAKQFGGDLIEVFGPVATGQHRFDFALLAPRPKTAWCRAAASGSAR